MQVVYTTRAVKQLAKLTRQQREAIEKICTALERWPSHHSDVKKLKNRPDWRLCVSRFRVIFEINEDDAVIVITQVVIRNDQTYR